MVFHYYLSTRSSHSELSLLASCQEGHKHLFLSQDSDPNSFVKGQEDRVKDRRVEAPTVPTPLTNSGTHLVQTLTSCSVYRQPAT